MTPIELALKPMNDAIETDSLTQEIWVKAWRDVEAIDDSYLEVLTPLAEPEWLEAVGFDVTG